MDEDGDTDRRQGVSAANEDSHFLVPRAFGLAIPTFDAWMLADESALTIVLQFNVQRQPELESLKKAQPKAMFEQLMSQSNCALSRTVVYLQVSQRIDHARLSERCPTGFAAFRQRLIALGERLGKNAR